MPAGLPARFPAHDSSGTMGWRRPDAPALTDPFRTRFRLRAAGRPRRSGGLSVFRQNRVFLLRSVGKIPKILYI